jgi:hypothetical protein
MYAGSVVENNLADAGGGIALYEADATLDMKDSTIRKNRAEDGGGLYPYNSGTITMIDSEISGNTSANRGGGVFMDGDSAALTFIINMEGGEISGNTNLYNPGGTAGGGGVAFGAYGRLNMSKGAVIKGNLDMCHGSDSDGGLHSEGTVTINVSGTAIIYGNGPLVPGHNGLVHDQTALPGDNCNVGKDGRSTGGVPNTVINIYPLDHTAWSGVFTALPPPNADSYHTTQDITGGMPSSP